MSSNPTDEGLSSVLAALRKIVHELPFEEVTLDEVALRAGTTVEALAAAVDKPVGDETLRTLLFEMLIESISGPIAPASAAAAAAHGGEEALHGFLTAFVGYNLERYDDFRMVFHDAPRKSMERFGVTRERLPIVYAVHDRLFGPTTAKLTEDWGGGELPHGLMPRKLVYTSYLAALGLLTMHGISQTTGDSLKYGYEELIGELSRALAAPVKAMRQLSALNDACSELAAMRDEEALVGRVSELLASTLDLGDTRFLLAQESSGHALLERALRENEAVFANGEVAAPVRVAGEPVAVITGTTQRTFGVHERTRLETFAKIVGLALDNARFYQTLQDQVDERTRELREAQAVIVHAEKMAATGQLVAGVAHELNTPVGAMMSGLGTLSSAANKIVDDAGDRPSVRQQRTREALQSSVAVIEEGAGRVAAIVKRLARFARIDRSEIDSVDVNECVADSLAALGGRLDGIRVTTDPGVLSRLTAAPADINQLLLSLLSNAVEAMPDGGDLTVTTSAEHDGVVVSVTDDGVGIEPAILGRVFDPGFTTRGVGLGGGYGLAIAYRIAQAHGGSIEIESQPGKGTTARVLLPGR